MTLSRIIVVSCSNKTQRAIFTPNSSFPGGTYLTQGAAEHWCVETRGARDTQQRIVVRTALKSERARLATSTKFSRLAVVAPCATLLRRGFSGRTFHAPQQILVVRSTIGSRCARKAALSSPPCLASVAPRASRMLGSLSRGANSAHCCVQAVGEGFVGA
jgi:hypothetical protein